MSLGQGVYIFEERPKSTPDVIGDVYCPGEFCLNREKCESIGGYVTTARSIHGCGKCGVWLFVHKVPFKLQEHVKTTKLYKTRFFFARKNELGTQKPKKERKNWVWTTSRLSEMCIFQYGGMKSVFTFQPIKQPVSTTVKSAKPEATI